MRFRQLDEVIELIPGSLLRGKLSLHGSELYLEDHFPLFRVMPGVLMLEGIFQAALWLVRVSDQFARPFVMLEEVRNAKFGDFLQPGESMEVLAEITKWEGDKVTIKGQGMKGESTGVTAKMTLRLNAIDTRRPNLEDWNEYYRALIMKQWKSLEDGTRRVTLPAL